MNAAAAGELALEGVSQTVLDALHARFVDAGYTQAAIDRAERVQPGLFDAVRLPLVHWHLARDATAGSELALLFAYFGSVPRPRLDALLGASVCESLIAAGLLAAAPSDSSRLIARCMIVPFESLWFVYDPPGAGADAVMGPGPTTAEIVHLLPAVLAGSVFDAGCGAGSLALVAAARGASPCVGADINPRAIRFAQLNARLNRLEVSFLCGSWMEPVAGRRFDWVLAQPPYVVQPPDVAAVTYLHGGARGDQLTRQLLAALPAALAPGGLGLVLADCTAERGAALHISIRSMLGDDTLDLVVLAAPGNSADLQAIGYAAVADPALAAPYADAVRRYRSHLAGLGDPEIRHAMLLVRRPVARDAGEAMTASLPVSGLRGRVQRPLAALFRALDAARGAEPALLAGRLRVPRTAKWTHELERPELTEAGHYRARFEAGALATDQQLSEASVVLLSCFTPGDTVAAAIERYAAACDASAAEVRPGTLEFVRNALVTGLLELDEAEPASTA